VRIALVHMRHARTGGTERFLDRLAAHLAGCGHEVVIVCRSHAEPSHPALRFQVLHGLALGGAWRTLEFARAVERHVGRARYDLVVGLGKTWTHDVIRLGGGCQRSYLELAHGATLTPGERLLGGASLKHALALRIEERALAPGAYRRVIVNSEMVRRDVRARHGVPDELIETVYNGVDLERFRPELRGTRGTELRAELGLGADELVVLFLGSGYARKGLDLLLVAFGRLLRERPEARLVVCGFDSARPRFERQARALGLGPALRFLGGRADPEACYAAADLFALPTRYDPFANATLEALAAGLPVITSTQNGGGELIEARVQGSVVDLAAGAAALGEELLFWSDPARRARGALAARALAERHGEAAKFARLEQLFAALAGESRTRAEAGA
jgi:UDP-glucose:(heptosyl)LPS alpha-1,3-glucosyltransferase